MLSFTPVFSKLLLFSIIPDFSILLFSINLDFSLLLFSIIPDLSLLLFSIIPDFSILLLLLISIIPLFDLLLSVILLRWLTLLLFLLFSSFSIFVLISCSLFSSCSFSSSFLLFSFSLFLESLSSSSSSLISSLSTSSPRTAKHNPSTSHWVFVIFFNSVFITTGFSSVSSSTKIIIPFLNAIIKCFFLNPSPSTFSSLFFPHHTIFAISKFFILSNKVISPICFPELANTKIFSFFFEIKILSSFGEYSIKLVSSSKLLNQVFFPSTVPEYICPSSYKKDICLPLLLHLTSTIFDTPRLFTICELYKSFSFLFQTTKELLPSTVTIFS